MAKSRKSKKVKSHKKVRKGSYCPHCRKYHYKSVHKMHGKGSYKKSRSKKNIAKAKRKARRR